MPIPSGIPSEIGGGPTRDEAALAALRAAVGTLAGPPDGLDDAWRRTKATGPVEPAVSGALGCLPALPG